MPPLPCLPSAVSLPSVPSVLPPLLDLTPQAARAYNPSRMSDLARATSQQTALLGRHRVLLFASLAVALAYLPWYNYSAVLPLVRRDFALSARDAGLILSSFQLGYVVVVILTGWLTDKVGARSVLVASTLVTGAASTGFGLFAGDFSGALIWRLLVGLGCGGLYVPGMALLSEWFDPRERGMALGTYTAAVSVSYAGAYFATGQLAGLADWRTAVVATSLPCFLAALVYWRGVPRAPLGSVHRVTGERKVGWLRLVGRRTALAAALLTLAYCAHMWEAYGFFGWVGPFFSAAALNNCFAGTQAVSVGATLAAVSIIVGAVGPWGGGILADRIGRSPSIMLLLAVSIPCSLSFGWLAGAPLAAALALGLVYGTFVMADSAVFKAGLTELLPAEVRATALAVQSALGFGVSIVSPAVFGIVLDATNPAAAGATPGLWGWAFVSLGLGALVGPLAILALRRLPEGQAMGGGRG